MSLTVLSIPPVPKNPRFFAESSRYIVLTDALASSQDLQGLSFSKPYIPSRQ